MANRFLGEEDPTTAWAHAAVDGKLIVGELVRHQAERHLRDLRDGARRGLHWRPDAAAHALGFLPAVFTVTDGPAAGEPFHPLEWHTFVIGSLFGWLTDAGRWRFRSAWLETGKGQAKSPLMGALGIYIMGWCGIPRAQVFAIGQDKRTANVLFRDSVAMCRATIPEHDDGDSLEARSEVIIRGEGENAWKIEHPDSGGFFQSLAGGEAQSGPRPAAVLADEIHEFKSDYSIETWKRAIEKIAGNAIMILGTNTPATSQHVGTSYSDMYQKVAKGEVRDDSAFAFIARVDKADRENVFRSEACWAKSLPALGQTYPIENVRETVASAALRVSTTSSVKRLYFGIPTGAADFWIDEERWAAVQSTIEEPVDEKALKAFPLWLSMDLSKKNDLTALSGTWLRADGMLLSKSWYWTTREGLADRAKADQAPYVDWVTEGYLVATPGATIDFTFVAKQIADLVAGNDVQALVVDPAFISDFITACEVIGLSVWRYEGPGKPEGRGLKIVSHAQGKRVMFEDKQLCMPHSITKTEDRILDRRIIIDASPVTYSWGKAGPSAEQQQVKAANDDRAYQGELKSAQDRYSQAQAGLSDTAEQRYGVQVDQLRADLAQRDAASQDQVAAGKLSGAEALHLQIVDGMTEQLQEELAKRKELSDVLARQLDAENVALDSRDTLLQIDLDMATTRKARLAFERQLLDDAQEKRRNDVAKAIGDASNPSGQADAVIKAQSLPATETAENAQLARKYQSPLSAYRDQLQQNVGDTGQDIGNLEVGGLHDLEDGLLSIGTGAKSAKAAMRDFVTSVLQDLEKLALEKGILALFGNLIPGGGSGTGGGAGSNISDFPMISGARAGGGGVDDGKLYLVGEKGPELFAPGKSGTIIPNHAINDNSIPSSMPSLSSSEVRTLAMPRLVVPPAQVTIRSEPNDRMDTYVVDKAHGVVDQRKTEIVGASVAATRDLSARRIISMSSR